MKNILSIIVFIFFAKTAFGDVIPENSHRVEKCVKIINANDFPEISLIGYSIHPSGESKEAFVIDANNCLEKGYKFNSFYILAVNKNYLKNKDINSIDWMIDSNARNANVLIECYGGYEDNSNPISSIQEFYTIVGFTDAEVLIYKSKQIIGYNDGRPNEMKTFSYVNGNEILNETSFILSGSKHDYTTLGVVHFLEALLLTILLELIVLFLVVKTWYRSLKISSSSLLFVGIVASFATLPYVWFVLPVLIKPGLTYILISEISVTIIESIVIAGLLKIDYKKALILSVLCNLTSFGIGLAISWAKFL